jgi:hypothetical protein
MAEIVKATGYTPVNYVGTTPVPGVSLASRQPPANCAITGLKAGENLAAGDACYIKGADGLVYRSTGAAVAAAAQVDGWAAENVVAGEAITLYRNVHFNYSAGLLVPGTSYYVSGTVVGGIADVASTGGLVVVARAIDASRLYVSTSY